MQTAAKAAPLPQCAAPPSPRAQKECVRTQFTAEEAMRHYCEQCTERHLGINRSVTKLLLSGTRRFDFTDNYLGDRGIVTVLETLSHLPVEELILRNCCITSDDVRSLYDFFHDHPTLTTVDLRANSLTDSAAKALLLLLRRNARVQEVLVDDSIPRYVWIRQQCLRNSCGKEPGMTNNAMSPQAVGMCVVCGTPFIQENNSATTVHHVNLLLSTVLEHFARHDYSASAVEVEIVFRALQDSCSAGDGVLFLCSEACAEQLGMDALQTARSAITLTHVDQQDATTVTAPKTPALRATVRPYAQELTSRRLADDMFASRRAALNVRVDNTIGPFLDEEAVGHRPPAHTCEVCGAKTDGLPAVAAQLLWQLQRDLSRRALCLDGLVGDNSHLSLFDVLQRVCRVLVFYASGPICSTGCVKDAVRFALFGYRGVIRAFPSTTTLLSEVSVSAQNKRLSSDGGGSLGLAEQRPRRTPLPQKSFAVVDFVSAEIDDVGDEDIVCALTVASAMEDIEGTPIDPYLIFALGRHLAGMPKGVRGIDLRSACEAVRVAGCITQKEAPFQRRTGERPTTTSSFSVGNWADWGTVFGDERIEKLMHSAFARRRQGLYLVDGCHGNLFDNIRDALWRNRNQRRCVVATMEFRLEWLSLSDGIVTDASSSGDSPPSYAAVKPSGDGGTSFFTAVKIVGQSIVAHSPLLILQSSLGYEAGKGGYFYVDTNVFVRHVCGNAYIFVDTSTDDSGGTKDAEVLARFQHTAPRALPVAANLTRLRYLLHSIAWRSESFSAADVWWLTALASLSPPRSLEGLLHMPAPMTEGSSKVRDVASTRSQERWLAYLRALLSVKGTMPTFQVLFLLSEICGSSIVLWLDAVLTRVSATSSSLLQIALQDGRNSITPTIMAPNVTQADSGRPLDEVSEHAKSDSQCSSMISSRGAATAPHKDSNVSRTACGKPSRALLKSLETTSGSMNPFPQEGQSDSVRQTNVLAVGGGTHCLSTRDTFPARLISRGWKAVHIVEEGSDSLSTVALFVEDHVCMYRTNSRAVLAALMPTAEHPLFSEFPFASGFDCAFNHPLRPQEVCFFSGTLGLVWDIPSMKCVAGPFIASRHPVFACLSSALPATAAVETPTVVVPLMRTPFVVLFHDGQCRLVNMETGRAEQQPQMIRDPSTTYTLSTDNIGKASLLENEGGKAARPVLSCEVLAALAGRLPLTAFYASGVHARGEEKEEPQLYLVLPHCEVACVEYAERHDSPTGTEPVLSLTQVLPDNETALAGLPHTLQRCVMQALPVVSRSLLTEEFEESRGDSNDLQLFEPGSNKDVRVKTSMSFANAADEDRVDILKMPSRSASEQEKSTFTANVQILVSREKHTEPSVSSPDTQTITLDVGAGNFIPFRAIVMVLDLPRSGSAAGNEPLMCDVAVQASVDGLLFLDVHRFTIGRSRSAAFTAAAWPECPARRYWRLTFLTPLADGLGVVRTLWYTVRAHAHGRSFADNAGDQQRSGDDDLLTEYTPPPLSYGVRIEAPCVFNEPQNFIGSDHCVPVFTTATPVRGSGVGSATSGWYEKHAVLPILSRGQAADQVCARSCLFFCGTNFVEYDVSRQDVVGHQSLDLSTHRSFRTLPFPFSMGLDMAFYPDHGSNPHVAVLVSDGKLLPWDLTAGSAVAPPLPLSESPFFRTVPVDLERQHFLVAILNIWDCPGEVFLLYNEGNLAETACRRGQSRSTVEVLRWNCRSCQAVGRCVPLSEHPEFRDVYSRLGTHSALLGVVSLPLEDGRVDTNMFADDRVCSSFSREACTINLSEQFYRLSVYLPQFGALRSNALVTVDFAERPIFAVGIELQSTQDISRVSGGASNGADHHKGEWLLRYSDDGSVWHDIGSHCHRGYKSRATWYLSMVGDTSHRFWQLETLVADSVSAVFTGIRFLIPPCERVSRLPADVHFSPAAKIRSGAPSTSIFVTDRVASLPTPAASATVHLPQRASKSEQLEIPLVSFVTDYGEDVREQLCGLTCELVPRGLSRSSFDVELWRVECSSDQVVWRTCCAWTANRAMTHLQVFWSPCGRQRFWRVSVHSPTITDAISLELSSVAFFNFRGYSAASCGDPAFNKFSQEDASVFFHSSVTPNATRLLTTARTPKVPTAVLMVRVGSVVTLGGYATNTVAVCGLHVACTRFLSPALHVECAVECSDDGVVWSVVTRMMCIRAAGETIRVAWPPSGPHGFWRVRVVRVEGEDGGALELSNFRIRAAPAQLYREAATSNSQRAQWRDGSLVFQLDYPCAMTRVGATLPANSVFAAERLACDESSWETVALLSNEGSRHPARVCKHFKMGNAAKAWRLRAVADGDTPATNVCWYSLADEESVPVDLAAGADVQLSAVGFTEERDLTFLTSMDQRLCSPKPVLTYAAGAGACRTNDDGGAELCTPRVQWRSPAPMCLTGVQLTGSLKVGAPEEAVATEPEAEQPDKRPRRSPKVAKAKGKAKAEGSEPTKALPDADKAAPTSDGTEENVAAAATPTVPTVRVETSYNGVDYVPMASASLMALNGGSLTVLWGLDEDHQFRFWRLSFTGLRNGAVLQLFSATWYATRGVAAAAKPSSLVSLSTANFAAVQEERLGLDEEIFCRRCRDAMDRAKARESQLRTADDSTGEDREADVAEVMLKLKRKYANFVGKTSKELSRKGAEPVELPVDVQPLVSNAAELSSELLYFVHKTAERYPESEAERLLSLVQCPITLAKNAAFSKKDSLLWFYPYFSVSGPVRGAFHGIENANAVAAFNLYWSKSFEVQRDQSVLMVPAETKKRSSVSAGDSSAPLLSELSPHLASPVLVVAWEVRKSAPWNASTCFPQLPCLPYVGFGNPAQPAVGTGSAARRGKSPPRGLRHVEPAPVVLMACAVNEMLFTSTYPLSVGEKSPKSLPITPYPYKISAGINFLQHATLPSFLVDSLQWMFPRDFLLSYKTTVVFTTSSLSSECCQLNFTLPAGEGIAAEDGCRANFGLHYIRADAVSFEVRLSAKVERGDETVDTEDLAEQDIREELSEQYTYSHEITFVSRGGMYVTDSGAPSVPVVFCGTLKDGKREVPVEIKSVTGATVRVNSVPGAALTDLCATTTLVVTNERVLASADVFVQGRLLLCAADRTMLRCSFIAHANQLWEHCLTFSVGFGDVQFWDLVRCTRNLLRADWDCGAPPDGDDDSCTQKWAKMLPIRFQGCTLTVDTLTRTCRLVRAHDERVASIYGQQPTSVRFSASVAKGFTLSATLESVTVGNMNIASNTQLRPGEGGRETDCVLFNVQGFQPPGVSAQRAATPDSPVKTAPRVAVSVDGWAAVFSSTSTVPVSLQLTCSSCLCLCSTNALAARLTPTTLCPSSRHAERECSSFVYPSFLSATVEVNAGLFFAGVAEWLGKSPIVRALRAKGIPFTFTPQEVTAVEPINLSRHRLSLVLRGVFFGSWVEVLVVADNLDAFDDKCISAVCNELATRILEQSAEVLWSAYENVVGPVSGSAVDVADGSFLARWAHAPYTPE